jgi:hypothetical protein
MSEKRDSDESQRTGLFRSTGGIFVFLHTESSHIWLIQSIPSYHTG